MFEQRVLYYLQQYLGQYVSGLDANALRISVFAGDVTLKNLHLKPEALVKLNLPVTVKGGLLGSLKLKIPWRSLGQSPVIVEIDSVFLLACPKTEVDSVSDTAIKDADSEFQAAKLAKQHSVDARELAWMHHHLNTDSKDDAETQSGGGGFLQAMIDTIIGNLQLSISNVHVRYEDDVSVPGCPIALGFTLQQLNAHTIDEAGKEVFVHKNALELLRKASELKRLAVYLDVDAALWEPSKPWDQLQRSDWDDLFLGSIAAENYTGAAAAPKPGHTYVLQPVDGQLHYTRRGRNVRRDESQPIQEASIALQTINLHVSRTQFQSLHKVSGHFATIAARGGHRQHRPQRPPTDAESAGAWWRYAGGAVRDLLPPTMEWKTIQEVGWMRRKYIPAYVECLQHNQLGGNEETRKMDESLAEPTILLFRRVAHAQVEREKRKAAAAAHAQKSAGGGGSWLGWLTGGGGVQSKPAESTTAAEGGAEELSEEEVAHLRGLVTEQEDAMDVGKGSPNSVNLKVSASVGGAAVVLDSEDGEVLRVATEGLNFGVTMFPQTLDIDVAVHAVGITSPEGTFLRSGRSFCRNNTKSDQRSQNIVVSEDQQPVEIIQEGSSEGDANSNDGGPRSPALQLGLVRNPQDGSADFVVTLKLSSSYITYSAAMLTRLKAFYHIDEVVDLSLVAAQAAVQVERARTAARRQMQAALNTKPKLQLHVSLDAPKVAIPIPAQDSLAAVTVVLDLGRFVLDSSPKLLEKSSEEEAAVYLPFELAVRNVSAYLVDGAFDWSLVGSRLTALLQAGGNDTTTDSVVIPILERCEMSAELYIAKVDHGSLPPLRLGLQLPQLRFFISPARLQRIMRVLHATLPDSGEDDTAVGQHPWRTNAEKEGAVSVLVWTGIGRSSAQWMPRHAVLQRASLHLLQSSDVDGAVESHSVGSGRQIIKMQPKHIGNVEHCLAICSVDVDVSRIAEDSTALVLRFSSDDEASAWKAAMQHSRLSLEALTGTSLPAADSAGDLAGWSDSGGSLADSSEQAADPSNPVLELHAALGEFSIFASGRVANNWWPEGEGQPADSMPTESKPIVNIDSEHTLICVRGSGATTDVSFGQQRLSIGAALGAFEIQDLLVGQRSKHSHLARSFQPLSTLTAQSGGSNDDEFHDAADAHSFSASTISHTISRNQSVSEVSMYLDANDNMDSAPSGSLEEIATGTATKPENFKAWTFDFQTIKPDSKLYKGVDVDMSMKLTSLWFFCNRPTVGALIGFGTDLAAATKVPSSADHLVAPKEERPLQQQAATEGQKFVVHGGQERTVFRLTVVMSHLEAAFNYEADDAAPLGAISVEDTRFSCKVHPDSIVISAGLGGVNGIDASLKEGHPYRKACRPREGASSSLIQVDIASHAAAEERDTSRMPAGIQFWSVNVDITQLQVVFLHRFLQEILGYVGVLLALRPEESLAEGAHHNPLAAIEHTEATATAAAAAAPADITVLLLDVNMEAPVIIMPRCSDSEDKMVADLGSLKLTNIVSQVHGSGSGSNPGAVLLDTMKLTMQGLNAKVDAEGHKGGNIIREYHEGTQIELRRALQDAAQKLPALEVAVTLPAIKASLSDYEFQLITSVAGANIGEETNLCDEALWMHSMHSPSPSNDASNDTVQLSTHTSSDPRQGGSTEQQVSSPVNQSSAHINIKAIVNVGKVELEMMRHLPEIRSVEPLAVFKVTDLWVSYHASDDGCCTVRVSVPVVVGSDARPGVLPEHACVISAGAADSDASTTVLTPSFMTLQLNQSPGKASLSVRLQQPQVVAEVGFILAVAKFVYPSLPVAGVAPIPFKSFDVLLQEAVTSADGDLYLCPYSRLLADGVDVEDYIYDGGGHMLVLPNDIGCSEQLPLIIVGAGKTLRLRNVIISSASSLAACLHLGQGAQFVASSEDNVTKLTSSDPRALLHSRSSMRPDQSLQWSSMSSKKMQTADALGGGRILESVPPAAIASETELTMDLVALDVGLHFVKVETPDSDQDQAKMPAGSPGASLGRAANSVRMLAAHFDATAGFTTGCSGTTTHAALQGLRVESQVILNNDSAEQWLASSTQGPEQGKCRVQGKLLEPCCLKAEVRQVGSATEVDVEVSALRLDVSVDVIELVASLQASVLAPFSPPRPDRPVASCAAYVKVAEGPRSIKGGSSHAADVADSLGSTAPGVAFWQPMPPAGYAILGHCVTIDGQQPSFQAVAVAINSGLVDYPQGFKVAWAGEGLTVWQPQPPEGFVAGGCIVTTSDEPPPLSALVCIHQKVAVRSSAGCCLPLCTGADQDDVVNVWSADNAAATFAIQLPSAGSISDQLMDLRAPLGESPAALSALFAKPAAAAASASAPPAPSSGKATSGDLSRQSASLDLRRMSSDSGFLSVVHGNAQQGRGTAKASPRMKSFRWFMRQREDFQRSESSARLKVSSVDFQRMWLDKATSNPTREGISLWRTSPPPGYFSLGDCVAKGYDPPRQATLIQNAEASSDRPLLTQPVDFRLVWSDDAAKDQRLAIWRSIPQDGYVAMGHVCSSAANVKPPRSAVHCVRADRVTAADLRGQRPMARLPKSGRREALRIWLVDDRLATFVVGVADQLPQQSELWTMRMLHPLDGQPPEDPNSRANAMKVTFKAAGARLVMKDVLRRPLAELEVGQVLAGLHRPCQDVIQATIALRASMWSYNTSLTAWEPVVEPWAVLLKLDSNTGEQAKHGTERGTRVGVTSTSDAMHTTIAYAAVSHILEAFLEWKGLQGGAKEVYRRQLAAADNAAAFTIMTNRLGVSARLELDHGSHTQEEDLPMDDGKRLLQPVAIAPSRSTPAAGISQSDYPPQLLLVDVLSAVCAGAVSGEACDTTAAAERQQLLVSARPSSAPGNTPVFEAHTRAVSTHNQRKEASWGERLVLVAPLHLEESSILFELREDSGGDDHSAVIGSAHVKLDNSFWESLSAPAADDTRQLQLQDSNGRQVWTLIMRIAPGGERYQRAVEVTDAWSADNAFAGSRALRVGRGEWVQVGTASRKSIGSGGHEGFEASTVLPVRINNKSGVAIETSVVAGVRRESLRSLAQVVNATALSLEVATMEPVVKSSPQSVTPAGRHTTEAPSIQTVVVFENERYMPLRGWSASNLLPTDRRRFSGPHGSDTTSFPNVPLDSGWRWDGAWEVETLGNTDKDGWAYALNWPLMRYPPDSSMAKKGFTDCVRRKRWVRRKKRGDDAVTTPQTAATAATAAATGSANSNDSNTRIVGVVQPGAKLALPLGWQENGWQIRVRVVSEGDATHDWSVGASLGQHTVKLDALTDGLTRLVSCQRLQGGGSDDDGDGLAGSPALWMSVTVEGEAFDEAEDAAKQPLTDWRIVIAPPLVIENTLPIGAHFIVWERSEREQQMRGRRSGHCSSKERVEVYSVDMRCRVALQFYPDGYDWAQKDPVTISEGFAGHEAGFAGCRALPDKFTVEKRGNKQAIYLTRKISNAWALAGESREEQSGQQPKGAALDPGTVVASGSGLLVRILVPAWIVNATSLSMNAAVVPMRLKARGSFPTTSFQGPGERMRNSEALLKATNAMGNLRVLKTGSNLREDTVSQQHLPPGALDIISFPLGATIPTKATDDRPGPSYGICFQAESSSWTEPMSLTGADGVSDDAASDAQALSTKPVLLRLGTADGQKVFEVVARVEMADGVFSRTLAVRLEPCFTVTNLSGFPIQLAQLAREPPLSEGRHRPNVSQHSFSGKLSRGSSSSLKSPASARSNSSSLVESNTDHLDLTTLRELQPGASKVTVEWSAPCKDSRALCLRLSSGDGAIVGTADEQLSSWSAPVKATLCGASVCHIAVPALPDDNTGNHEPEAVLHGPRVSSCLLFKNGGRAAILRYHVRVGSPGCLALVLEAVSLQSPYVLENKTPHPLLFRGCSSDGTQQRFQELPPYSAAGYTVVALDDVQKVEIRDASSPDAKPQYYVLNAPDRLPSTRGSAQENDDTLPALHLSEGGDFVQPAVGDRELEASNAAGLADRGMGGAMGRRGSSVALRLLPGSVQGYGHMTLIQDRAAHSLAVSVSIGHMDLSVVDHTPEELLNLTLTGLQVEYASGIGVGGTFTSFRVRVQNLQLDDQLPFTRFPVVIAATEEQVQIKDQADPETEAPPVVIATIVSQPGSARRQVYYPHIAFRLSRVLQVSVSETLMWRTVTMLRRLDIGRLTKDPSQGNTPDGSVHSTSPDVPIQVRLMSLGDVQTKVSFRGDLSSRPKWAAQMLSVGLNLADFEGVPVRISGLEVKDANMSSHVFVREIVAVIKSQLLGVAFKFMANFGILSGASGILGIVSAGVASLGLDQNFAAERTKQRQERSIGGVREGLAEGGEALSKGFYKGMTGLVSKPMEGAQSRGISGFVKGVGKGLVGAVAAPVSGGLDMFSSAMEGLDASKDSLLGRPRAGNTLDRRRLPRTIGGDFKLLPFIREDSAQGTSERAARVEEVGQAVLWLTGEVASGGGARSAVPFLGLRRRHSRSADAYEDHFLLPDDKVAILTSRAILLVVAPTFAALHNKAEKGVAVTDMREIPTAALVWRVQWDDLLALEPYTSRRSTGGETGRDGLVVYLKGRAAAASGASSPQELELAHKLNCYASTSMSEQIRAVTLRVAAKYYGDPLRQQAMWQRRHSDSQPGAAIQGLEQQQLPATALSLDFRLLWRAPSDGSQPRPCVWRPICVPGYLPVGDVLSMGFDPPSRPVRTFRAKWPKGENREQLPTAAPLDFHLVWRSVGRSPVTMWEPVAPLGYIALGTVLVAATEAPSTADVLCVAEGCTKAARLFDSAAWQCEPAALSVGINLQRLKAYEPQTWRCSLWQVDNDASTFIASRALRQPPREAAKDVSGTLGSR